MRKFFPNMLNLPDNNPLILDEKDAKILDSFNLEIAAIQREKILHLRRVAREKGIIASTLEELKSESGEPFKEEKPDNKTTSRNYRMAVVLKTSPVLGTTFIYPTEIAYLCCAMHTIFSKEDLDSCGWVKGNPIEKKYDDIGILSGSAGVRFYCKICDKQIGEHRLVVS